MVTEIAKIIIRLYRWTLGTVLPNSCRFTPSCSEYTLTALSRYGFRTGGYLAIKRLLRCNPFFTGGYDPVPGKTANEKKQ